MTRPEIPLEGAGDVLEGGPEPEAPVLSAREGSVGSDVFKLVSGATLAQLSTVLVSPILTRLYDPAAFGMAALFTSITGVLSVIACVRYELAIVLPKRDEEAANLLGVSLLFALFTSFFTVPIVLLGTSAIPRLLKAPELGQVLWFVPPVVLAGGVFLALSQWSARTRRFGGLAITRVSSSVATSAGQLAAAAVGHATGPSLVGATVFGTAVATGVLGGRILRDDGRLFRRSIRWKGIRSGISRYRKFPLYGTASTLFNAVSWQLPAFLLQAYFSSAVVGFYALGNRILRLPMSLIGNAIGQVFFQRAAEARRSGDLAATVESSFRRLVALSLLPMVLLSIVGREAFAFAFGSRWAEAGLYAQILAPWTFFWFLSSPLSTLFEVLERQQFGLKLNVVILATRFGSLAVGGRLQNARLALVLFSGSGVLVYGFYTFAILQASGVNRAQVVKLLLRQFAELLPGAAILLALKAAHVPVWSVLGAAAALFAIYGVRIVRSDPALAGLRRTLNVFSR